ncbi:MAG: SpoVR family protein, partial [Deltaproteobacteria bacterium]|nr:SpoVR family protein [Deltaproteobacteria bacterium]
YPHWRFGMEYEQLSKSAEYGLSTIYEMVINNTPSIAYLLEGNSETDQKLVMAHVYGHVDFFRHNYMFRSTDQGRDPETNEPIRKWIDTMANHGALVRKWQNRYGVETVEEFIDVCLSLENLIDPYLPYSPRKERKQVVTAFPEENEEAEEAAEIPRLRVSREYMEDYINPQEFLDAQRKKMEDEKARKKRFPEKPARDVLLFLLEHAPLERWEYDVLNIVRQEAYYFTPQAATKIMNEGWASYWHSKMMTEKILDADGIIDYADRCAGVFASAPGRLNPYKLGVELFRHIEDRWNKGRFGKEWEECDDLEARRTWDRRLGKGREKILQVRALYNDVTFIDEFVTPEFVLEQKLYSFGFNDRNDRWEIDSREFASVKQKMLFMLTNRGQPFIYVEDANLDNRGELLLRHDHQGIDLKLDWARETLKALQRVWRRPVSLSTINDGKATMLRYDGKEHTTRAIR